MNVWGISDLHLSFARPDRRERYAARWRDHAEKIEREWREVVARKDLVLLPGDLSMARNHRDLQPDLSWLARLPGTKVLSAGNHDAWFNRVEAIRPMMRPSMFVVGGDAVEVGGRIVCGTKGVPVPSDDPNSIAPPLLEQELAALDQALERAVDLRVGNAPLYVLWHYPPFDDYRRPNPCVAKFESADVTACLYGHLHAESQWPLAVQGEVRGVRYHCVAADAIGFRPLRISCS